MATKRKTHLITANEDVSAADIAENEVSKVLGGTEIADAVSVMQGEEILSQSTILTNEDSGIVTASLSKKEADQLGKKKEIKHVEEDEEVFVASILDQDGHPFSNDDGGLVEEDPEAEEKIEYAQNLGELDDLSEKEAAAMAALATDYEPENYDGIDFDEEANAFALSGSEDKDVADAFTSAGVAMGNVYALLKCVINLLRRVGILAVAAAGNSGSSSRPYVGKCLSRGSIDRCLLLEIAW